MSSSLPLQEFLRESEKIPVIDVRSPGEFTQGHIPGAYNLPLFNNEERAKVGTAYVQIGKEEAIRIGYELANPKTGSFLLEAGKISKEKKILVHCWRGGMRSAKFAELLNSHGFEARTLIKGYKAYRRFVLDGFSHEKLQNVKLLIIGGETGSGKTEILKHIAATGEQVIDLEALAHHKGSAFGALGEEPQPTYEHFENELSFALGKLDLSKRIWLEDESRNIGRTQIPSALWEKMKEAPILRVTVPRKMRV
jgi:tRNA 2-selenouridine synthase